MKVFYHYGELKRKTRSISRNITRFLQIFRKNSGEHYFFKDFGGFKP